MKQAVQKNFLLVVLILAVGFAFAMKVTIFQKPATTPPPSFTPLSTAFTSYWLAGKAEVNTYRLEQAQNGVLNPGQATLIFGTEGFLTDKQVTSTTEATRVNTIPVLKANISKTFVTGMSDNALSTSIFTPINNPLFPNTLKVSTSEQSWSGNSYLQINYRNNAYQVSGKSYVENEVEEAYEVAKVMLEDELWNRIRLNPDKLPTDEIQLIPGTMTARLRHKRPDPLAAKLTLTPYEGVLYPGKLLKAYTIQYPTDDRTLVIIFESQFPHKIVGWEETYKSKDNLLTSRAVLKKTIQTDYQHYNAPADSTLRAAAMN